MFMFQVRHPHMLATLPSFAKILTSISRFGLVETKGFLWYFHTHTKSMYNYHAKIVLLCKASSVIFSTDPEEDDKQMLEECYECLTCIALQEGGRQAMVEHCMVPTLCQVITCKQPGKIEWQYMDLIIDMHAHTHKIMKQSNNGSPVILGFVSLT